MVVPHPTWLGSEAEVIHFAGILYWEVQIVALTGSFFNLSIYKNIDFPLVWLEFLTLICM